MRLLLVEDDVMIGAGIRMGLRQEDFVVDWVQDGRAAELALAAEAYAAVLLDLGLPRKDGFAVLEGLRRRKNRVPVLIITARDAVADRVKGLEERIYGWGEEVASNSVEVHVHNLRKKLGDATIRTVRGVGYAIANDSDAPCQSAGNSS